MGPRGPLRFDVEAARVHSKARFGPKQRLSSWTSGATRFLLPMAFRPKSAKISSPGALDPDSGRSRRPGSIREGPGARNGPPEAESGDLGLGGGGGRKFENPGRPFEPFLFAAWFVNLGTSFGTVCGTPDPCPGDLLPNQRLNYHCEADPEGPRIFEFSPPPPPTRDRPFRPPGARFGPRDPRGSIRGVEICRNPDLELRGMKFRSISNKNRGT